MTQTEGSPTDPESPAGAIGPLPYYLGLDIGTSRTRASLLRPETGEVELFRFDDGNDSIATVVRAVGDGLAVGESMDGGRADEVASGFAFRAGHDDVVPLGGRTRRPEELVAAVASFVVDAIERREGFAALSIVLACPAHWSSERLARLESALAEAGLDEISLSGSLYAIALGYAASGEMPRDRPVVLYSTGASVFCAGVFRWTDHGIEQLGTSVGDDLQGGDQVDDAVLAHVRRAVPSLPADQESLRACREARNVSAPTTARPSQ